MAPVTAPWKKRSCCVNSSRNGTSITQVPDPDSTTSAPSKAISPCFAKLALTRPSGSDAHGSLKPTAET
jgi:hypothetical protein